MSSENWMIVGGDLLPSEARPDPAESADAAEVELEVQPLDQRFCLSVAERPVLIVGRSPDCDVMLAHPLVSYRHAYLQLIGGQVHCVDLASRSGTYWGAEHRDSGWLLPGHTITIGPYQISHSSSAVQTIPPPPALYKVNLLARFEPDQHRVREAELTLINGELSTDGERIVRLTRPITLVGSSKRCRIRFGHPSVSRVHCSLTLSPDGVWITDLLGKGGTFVNGQPVGFRLLDAGDEVAVGELRFAIQYRDAGAAHAKTPFDSGAERPAGSSAASRPVHAPAQRPGADGGFSGDFVLALMDRFAAMQQQMAAMSQQQMMFMAQLVTMMHQNHHEVVKQELGRINAIGEQIEQLREQLREQSGASSQAADAPDSATAPLPPPEAAPEPPASPQFVLPQGIVPPLDLSPAQDDPAAAASSPEFPVAQESATSAGQPAADTGESAAGEEGEESEPGPRYTPGDVRSHSDLIERMAELEHERSSRWKKIMKILAGTGP